MNISDTCRYTKSSPHEEPGPEPVHVDVVQLTSESVHVDVVKKELGPESVHVDVVNLTS